MGSLDKIIEKSFEEMGSFLSSANWFGRENEIVNLFAHKFLLPNFDGDKLKFPSQIGIEVAVKQLAYPNAKELVRKDLVIWPTEYNTVWKAKDNASNVPLAIIEWKVNSEKKCKSDIEWLSKYTQAYPGVLGYSACAYIKRKRAVVFFKIQKGKIT